MFTSQSITAPIGVWSRRVVDDNRVGVGLSNGGGKSRYSRRPFNTRGEFYEGRLGTPSAWRQRNAQAAQSWQIRARCGQRAASVSKTAPQAFRSAAAPFRQLRGGRSGASNACWLPRRQDLSRLHRDIWRAARVHIKKAGCDPRPCLPLESGRDEFTTNRE
jgi:hypothetical protein